MLLVLIVIVWCSSGVLMDYQTYRRLCAEEGKVTINEPILSGLAWQTKEKSDAQWIVKNFPGVPFARYEKYHEKLYDLRDAGQALGRAHNYEVKEADLSLRPRYILKRQGGNINGGSRVRYYATTVFDSQQKNIVIESKVFGFTWWVLGDSPYGLTSTSTCFDPHAIEKIKKSFESRE